MISLLIALWIFVFSPECSHAAQTSALRYPAESYPSALTRNLLTVPWNPAIIIDDSVLDRQTSLEKLDILSIPQVKSEAILNEMYRKIRDTRDWTWREMPSFPRRLIWLYPEDGCYLRANLMGQKLKEWNYVSPKQIFAFGDLSFSTTYDEINWWYHVAPIVRLGKDPYVIDPALEYHRPLLLKEWVKKISKNIDSVQLSLCETGAVNPNDSCNSFESHWDPIDRDITLQNFLELVCMNLKRLLGKSPEGILGSSPPWKKDLTPK
jgi:hypothetical protein